MISCSLKKGVLYLITKRNFVKPDWSDLITGIISSTTLWIERLSSPTHKNEDYFLGKIISIAYHNIIRIDNKHSIRIHRANVCYYLDSLVGRKFEEIDLFHY